jgi:hypothetical protein
MTEVKRVFTVKGKPFYPLGAQADNQSGRSSSESETAFKAVKMLHGNTLLIAVHWEQIEPEEGKFDFSCVDALLANARRYDLKLILLWFATWFAGTMDFSPAWVKTNPKRFKQVTSPSGKIIWSLSPHCKATLEADKKAFTAFCKYLKTKDSVEQTVIGIQVENEPGIVGSDRDYGPEAQAEFDSPVPTKLVTAMKTAGKGSIYDIWQLAGGKKSGTWPELFGWEAGELMTARSIATYIDAVAEAGKTVYDIPMYINVWIMAYPFWSLPGVHHAAGGAVSRVLDIYKWSTPHVDIIAPDVYLRDTKSFEYACAAYSRKDNPFFLPESVQEVTNGGRSAQPWNMFRAMAEYNLTGYFFFGVEFIVTEDGSPRPEFRTLVDTMHCMSAVIPLLLKYQGTGKVHAVAQDEFVSAQGFDFDGYMGLTQFGGVQGNTDWKDWRHPPDEAMYKETPGFNRGRGLIFQASRNEFYVVGANYRLVLRPKPTTDTLQEILPVPDLIHTMLSPYISVDEGHFDKNGKFVAERRRNGGQVFNGIWVEPDCGVVRVVMREQ